MVINMVYFDYGATTPIDKDVLTSYIKASEVFFANTSSLHFLGKEANQMYLSATSEIMQLLNLNDYHLIYTSNATEANNLALLGYTKNLMRGRIITTKVEHASVYEVMKALESKFDIVYLDIDKNGQISLDELKKNITKDTILVSVMWVNNIVGSIMDIQGIIKILKDYPQIKLHVDCVQGLGKIVPDFSFSDLDLWTFSTHKLYGPKGVGGLFIKNNIVINKILYGSNVQYGLRPGTFDTALVIASAKAIKKFYPLTEKNYLYVKKLSTYIMSELKKNPQIIINTPLLKVSPYIINISIPAVLGEVVLRHLEKDDIYVSTGSACSSKQQKPERTVLALTKNEKLANSSIRITLSHLTTYEEANLLIKSLNSL